MAFTFQNSLGVRTVCQMSECSSSRDWNTHIFLAILIPFLRKRATIRLCFQKFQTFTWGRQDPLVFMTPGFTWTQVFTKQKRATQYDRVIKCLDNLEILGHPVTGKARRQNPRGHSPGEEIRPGGNQQRSQKDSLFSPWLLSNSLINFAP